MNKLALIMVAATILGSCAKENKIEGVKYSGSMMEIHQNKLDATITLNELKGLPNLYALGAMEGLKGEIQIYNSLPSVSKISEEKISIQNNFQANAALLVYAQVPEWQEFKIPKPILTMKQLEEYIKDTATKAGVDTSKPFPFLVEGYIRKLNWHIVNWDENNTDHSAQSHMDSGIKGVVLEQLVEILGFYSNAHRGEFTHFGSDTHMHFNGKDITLAGHVDDLLMGEYMTLKLPKQ